MRISSVLWIPALLILQSITFLTAGEHDWQWGIWQQKSLGGSLALQGTYRSQETVLRNDQRETPRLSRFDGILTLLSRSVIWHPNFMLLDAEAVYNPAAQQERFLVIPNRTENRTAEQLRLQATFFNERPLYAGIFGNWSHLYINREYTSNVESYRRDFGGNLSFRNGYLPLSLHYLNSRWRQNEVSRDRSYTNQRRNVRAELSESFSDYDDHQITYSYEDYERQYSAGTKIRNFANSIRLQDNLTFGAERNTDWRSLVWWYDQSGDQAFRRWQVNELMQAGMPAGFKGRLQYHYNNYETTLYSSAQHNMMARLEHRLYNSLNSHIYYQYNDQRHSNYHDFINEAGTGFDYRKQIPTGHFNLSYMYQRRNDRRSARPGTQSVNRSDYQLADNALVLLDDPFVDAASVVVSDANRTIIYQHNIDYILIVRGDYLEIQRLPGGQIDNGATVYVAYRARQQRSYVFDTDRHRFSARLSLFGRLAELYFRYFEQEHGGEDLAGSVVLKTANQRVVGVRLNHGPLTAGAENDDHNSNIVPYSAQRYFVQFNHTFNGRLNMTLTGHWRDYELTREREDQQFTDLTGRVLYNFSRDSRLQMDGGYRHQTGRRVNLNLFNWRLEWQSRYRALRFAAGLEVFRRDFSGEKINYNGGYFRVERTF